MDLKERLITQGYDHIDILLIDQEGNQTTIADIALHKITDLEYKLYLNPDSISYHFNKENPYFEADQRDDLGNDKKVKGFPLEW